MSKITINDRPPDLSNLENEIQKTAEERGFTYDEYCYCLDNFIMGIEQQKIAVEEYRRKKRQDIR